MNLGKHRATGPIGAALAAQPDLPTPFSHRNLERLLEAAHEHRIGRRQALTGALSRQHKAAQAAFSRDYRTAEQMIEEEEAA